ncbi:MAG: acetate--CoA ligase family protein [Spirochaetota bacterium]|nr:acetate--CoA ligase family protein [Spirochaetota bacterium]
MKNNLPNIKYLFEPCSVAVVGASNDSNKIGYRLVENILAGGYSKKIYPINPKGGEVLGIPAYKSIKEIDDEIDLACIAIPSNYVFDAVKSCVDKNVKFIPIITSGFSEVGNIKEEKEIVSYALDNGSRILGPNIFGIYSAKVLMNATFGPKTIQKGNVAIITQSGALGIAMIGKSAVENIGLSTIVSVGNKSDIDEADLLEYLLVDNESKAILMYMEGIHKGDRLLEMLYKATKVKPVIVIKSGRSKRGAIAAASHTGSLAGADGIFDDVMKQCGVLRAESLQEAFDWCKFLANTPLPKGENCVILTNGGGVGVMATDACEKYNIKLYDDPDKLRDIFSSVTPDFGSTKNPVDLTGQAKPSHYESALDAALKDDNIHSVVALYCETALETTDFSKIVETSYHKYKNKGKPFLFTLFGGERTENCILNLRKHGLSIFSDVYEAISCLGTMYSHYHHLIETYQKPEEADIDISKINKIIENAIKDKRYFLLAHEAMDVMKIAGLIVPKSFIANSMDEAVRYAEDITYPVVMKIVSREVLHKSDVGGVALNLENKNEVIDAYQAILHNVKMHHPNAKIDGIEVSEMVKSGTETIIGARKDSSFGSIVMFGLGGIYVEVMKDVSFRAYPLSKLEIRNMIKSIKSYPLLLGVRGESKKDIPSVVEAIIKLGTVISRCKNITDIEINPLIAYEQGKGVKAVDIRVLLKKNEGGNV